MPKSRKRKGSGSRSRQTPTAWPSWMKTLLLADDAERRGDAATALELMKDTAHTEDGEPIWRPWRMQYVAQFAELGTMLPRWAYSRWVLAQAMQWLDEGFRGRFLSALDTAIDVRGGEGTLPGHDYADQRARVMDHDWVFRQVALFELGKLQRFIRIRAASDLLVGADDMAAWSRARIDAYRLIDRRPARLTWMRERDDELLTTPNTGCAAMLWPGDPVLGRLVPTEGGQVFESAPLLVTDEVAHRVAAAPETWLEVLRDWEEYALAVPLTRPTEHDGLIVELPPIIWTNVVCDQPDTYLLRDFAPHELARAAVDLGRFLLEEFVPPDFCHLDTWACLAAAFVEPDVVRELTRLSGADVLDLFTRLADVFAEPAATVCRQLATGNLPRAA